MKVQSRLSGLLACILLHGATNVDAGKKKGRRNNDRRSFIATPTYTPEMEAETIPPTYSPTDGDTTAPTYSPTYSPTWEDTSAPTYTPAWEAETSPPTFILEMDAETVPPTYVPEWEMETNLPTVLPTDSPSTGAPSFAPILNAEVKKPTTVSPGTSTAWYSFTTAPASNPILNAGTNAPHCVNETKEESPTTAPIANAETVGPSPALGSTMYPTLSSTLNPTLSPTLNPTLSPTLTPTMTPTRTGNTGIPSSGSGPDAQYSFTTSPVLLPTLNTETSAPLPTASPSCANHSSTPSDSPSLSPVLVLGTETEAPTTNSSIKAPDAGNSADPNATAVNTTNLCKSDSGTFFLEKQKNENVSLTLEVITFMYQVETIPRVSATDVLPSLEVAFVDSLLPVLFPVQCASLSALPMRALQFQVFGISSDPADEVNGECEPKVNEKNGCTVVNGRLSIFSRDGDTDLIIIDVKEALIESINDGVFNDIQYGIVSVSHSWAEIVDEGVGEVEDTDSSVTGNQGADIVIGPSDDRGSMLGIGLSLSAAGVFILAVGASVYRRKKKLGDPESSTLQEGGTVNGLSRFDLNSHDAQSTDESYTGAARELKIMPLSPAASRSIVENRYTPSARNSS